MNYVPIFSPINGIVSSTENNEIKISIRKNNDNYLYSPVSGDISEIVTDKNINKISIMNNLLADSIHLIIDGTITINKKINDSVEYNENIGEIFGEISLKIHFNKNISIEVVDVNTYVNSGETTIAYLQT